MDPESKSRTLYENLDTSFVSLWALLRHLSGRAFVGRVRVELKDYTADVFLTGLNTPLVHEVDRAAGTDMVEEAALHRLVLRAREAGGSISVYEGADEAVAVDSVPPGSKTVAEQPSTPPNEPRVAVSAETPQPEAAPIAAAPGPEPVMATPASEPETRESPATVAVPAEPEAEADWNEVVKASGELIGGVERAVTSAGANFASLFREARLEVADDYTFLDPISGSFEYANSVVTTGELPAGPYVAGVSAALRRVVDKVATGNRARRVRERVALDLALAARKRNSALPRSGFHSQLDRIAGTKVI